MGLFAHALTMSMNIAARTKFIHFMLDDCLDRSHQTAVYVLRFENGRSITNDESEYADCMSRHWKVSLILLR